MRTPRGRRGGLAAICLCVAALASGQQHWGGSAKRVEGGAVKIDVHETAEAIVIALGADVLFDFDRADLKPEAEAALRKVAGIVARFPHGSVLIEGYTDNIGGERYNQELSERRAGAVKGWLATQGGVDETRIATRGWGKASPVAPNTHPDGSDNPEGRAKNRRVEITVSKR